MQPNGLCNVCSVLAQHTQPKLKNGYFAVFQVDPSKTKKKMLTLLTLSTCGKPWNTYISCWPFASLGQVESIVEAMLCHLLDKGFWAYGKFGANFGPSFHMEKIATQKTELKSAWSWCYKGVRQSQNITLPQTRHVANISLPSLIRLSGFNMI